ncbi:MAG: hypothetical protein ACREJG_01735, partial [Candidatus Rokuibacteriota bacterium]
FLARWGSGVALGFALGSIQLFPFLEYAGESAVLAYRREWIWTMSLPLRAAITFLLPYYYGNPTGDDFWGPTNFNEITASVGIVPWVALPGAFVLAWSRPGTRYFATVALLAASMVYGLPWLGAALASLPPFSFAVTTRMSSFLVLSLCVLCSLGLDRLAEAAPAARRAARAVTRVAFVVLAGLAFFFVVDGHAMTVRAGLRVPVGVQYAWFLGLLTIATVLILRLLSQTSSARWAWAGLAAVELASVLPLAVTYNPVTDARLLYPVPAIVQHLQRGDRDYSRVAFTAHGANAGTMFRLFEADGYDGMTPRRLEQVADPRGSLDSLASGAFSVTADASSRMFDLLGIRHVVSAPAAERPAPHFTLRYDGADGRIYRNERALPRAFLVFRTRTCLEDTEAVRLIRANGIDFGREAVIAACAEAPVAGPRGSVAHAEIREYRPDRVVVGVATDAPGYLVLTDTWFPGWRASANGADLQVWRANHAFRAVWLPPGRHDVEFRYASMPFRYGLAVSVAAAVVLLALLVNPRRKWFGAWR